MRVIKCIVLTTIIIFSFMQLQSCTNINKDTTTHTEFSNNSLTTKKTADTSSNSSIINTKTLSIGAGVAVVGGLLVVGGIALLNGLTKGLGQNLAGHIA